MKCSVTRKRQESVSSGRMNKPFVSANVSKPDVKVLAAPVPELEREFVHAIGADHLLARVQEREGDAIRIGSGIAAGIEPAGSAGVGQAEFAFAERHGHIVETQIPITFAVTSLVVGIRFGQRN